MANEEKSEISGVKRKILIIDDDKIISEMYATKFIKEGFEVSVAYDGKNAIGKIEEVNPDAILLDLVMYPLDGFGVLEEINKKFGKQKYKIIILSNLGQKEDIERGMELGAANFIVKANSTPSKVVERVEEMLGG
ncbi:MAG: response regulator [bacterium]|nr:response regulator [bacterium]